MDSKKKMILSIPNGKKFQQKFVVFDDVDVVVEVVNSVDIVKNF